MKVRANKGRRFFAAIEETKMHRAILRSGDSWLDFQDPVNVVQTFDLDQVVPKLSQVEQSALGQDLYAVGFISYEAASAFDPALITHASRPCPLDQDPLPLLTFASSSHLSNSCEISPNRTLFPRISVA